MRKRGFFGVALYHPKNSVNVGSLLRTADILGAKYFATVGPRYQLQSSDTRKTHRHVPMFEYKSFETFKAGLPRDTLLIAVEMGQNAQDLKDFAHPERACYLMGAEDSGIPESILAQCHRVVKLAGEHSMNVSVAGSIVLYHREGL